MTEQTLRKMSVGGIYDHIGGGFHRYAVDAEWRVPHFEKMLYDQAQLVNSYLDLYQITKDPLYGAVVNEVLDYVLRDMTGAGGGFFSAEDADSPRPENPEESGEGAFYVWSKKEILGVLGDEAGDLFCYYYGVEEAGNAPFDPQNEFTGKNILYVAQSLAETSRKFGKSEDAARLILERSRKQLFDVRARRPRPHLDDKILTAWNGLMIGALAHASQVLDEPRYLQAAQRSAEFIFEHLYDPNSRTLRRRYREGEAKYEAHLDDYAFLTQGLLDLYEASLDFTWLQKAVDLTTSELELFWDHEHGGFFDTSGKDSSILTRLKEQYDGAEPTGNSVAAMNLLRLSEMTDNREWRTKAGQTISVFAGSLEAQPVVMPQMVAALDFSINKPKQIIIAGRHEDAETKKLLKEVFGRYLPNKIILFADGAVQQKKLAAYLPFLATLSMVNGKPTAYICQDYVCQLPTSDLAIVAKLLDERN